MLNPKKSWSGSTDFKEEVTKLGSLFVENFKKYADEATPEVIKAGMSNLWKAMTFLADRCRPRGLIFDTLSILMIYSPLELSR